MPHRPESMRTQGMDSRKRKFDDASLGRRIRARQLPEQELDDVSASSISEEDVRNGESAGSQDDSDMKAGDEREEDTPDSASDDESPAIDTSKVSFGALARAQADLSSSRRGKGEAQSLKGPSDGGTGTKWDKIGARRKPPARPNKHAPAEMTSKRPVSRKREVIVVHKTPYRDPRFSAATGGGGGRLAEIKAAKAYAFLDDYREDEMRQLRAAIKKAKKPDDKEELQRALMSMESRKKAREKKEHEHAVVEEHRRREKELVKQGKKPFYLKKSEQKKRLLLDQFASMSEKKVDKAIMKKRKKMAAKEKRAMPFVRRNTEST